MADWGSVVAGAVSGGSKGALVYDKRVKDEAHEKRVQDALFKQQTALQKTRLGSVEGIAAKNIKAQGDRQAAQIKSSEGIAAAGRTSAEGMQKKRLKGDVTIADKRIGAAQDLQAQGVLNTVAAEDRAVAREPSGSYYSDYTPVPKGVLKSMSPGEKKRMGILSPKDMVGIKTIADKASKNAEIMGKIAIAKAGKNNPNIATADDVADMVKHMDERMMFDAGTTPEQKAQIAAEALSSMYDTSQLRVAAPVTPKGAGGGSVVSAIDAAMKASLGGAQTPGMVTKPIARPQVPDLMPSHSGALDIPGL